MNKLNEKGWREKIEEPDK